MKSESSTYQIEDESEAQVDRLPGPIDSCHVLSDSLGLSKRQKMPSSCRKFADLLVAKVMKVHHRHKGSDVDCLMRLRIKVTLTRFDLMEREIVGRDLDKVANLLRYNLLETFGRYNTLTIAMGFGR